MAMTGGIFFWQYEAETDEGNIVNVVLVFVMAFLGRLVQWFWMGKFVRIVGVLTFQEFCVQCLGVGVVSAVCDHQLGAYPGCVKLKGELYLGGCQVPPCEVDLLPQECHFLTSANNIENEFADWVFVEPAVLIPFDHGARCLGGRLDSMFRGAVCLRVSLAVNWEWQLSVLCDPEAKRWAQVVDEQFGNVQRGGSGAAGSQLLESA
ncbi:hypothetical protein BDK51DRAFT_31632 [Blyttiomyces helicus]|uniref:Uncharacterized protein n=1 Tax=Blyttiomyces helicus TaxID=388810 RepID=A0A4P9WKN5_9FUNG|nr:hypothetical protein BDK51DRAFT_31632 [Blyttiomyces helicus]|eukprot:RKO91176.1 hypothetical protein BDK51DRAFT_31632 [Blyttiomyces helicus]